MGFRLDSTELASIQTPVYYYDTGLLEQTLDACMNSAKRHGFKVHYALKANFNPRLLDIICSRGFGADCVSGNEIKKALEMGFAATQIVFAGVGKTDAELLHALKAGIACFNCESLQELEVLDELAASLGIQAPVAIRINPNVNAGTHKYITTGLADNKFGVNLSDFADLVTFLRKAKNLSFKGLHVHIGSQITDLEVFKNLCVRVNEIRNRFEAANLQAGSLNVGGGLGIDYFAPDQNPIPDFAAYFDVFARYLERRPGDEVHFELGRCLVGQCGSLLSKVLFIKKGSTNFIVLDAGMTELIRPALYQAYHQIENYSRQNEKNEVLYDVVGPVCETSDTFRKEVLLPESARGDLFVIRSAGAYGEVMASSYNLREHLPAIFSSK